MVLNNIYFKCFILLFLPYFAPSCELNKNVYGNYTEQATKCVKLIIYVTI